MADTVPDAPGLVYASDEQPGITRVRRGRGFSYHGPDGKLVRDRATLARIRALAIPPAYADVWICPDPLGHIQATGRDAKGRKQYRYHPDFRAAQEDAKFTRLARFGAQLPAIRAQIEQDIRARSTTQRCVVATIVHLLDATAIRIGNAAYAQQNKSFGLTTLRRRHVALDASTIRFRFTGKSGRKWDLSVRDRRVARVIRGLQELPGQDLFRYVDGDQIRPVTSDDINRYLRAIGGEDFSAKDFRTWHGSVTAARALAALRRREDAPATEKAIRAAMDEVAAALRNTAAICRKSYVHPALLEAYRADHPLFADLPGDDEETDTGGHLAGAETAVLDFLKAL